MNILIESVFWSNSFLNYWFTIALKAGWGGENLPKLYLRKD